MPKKTTDGRWLVDIRPHGVDGPRIRKKFDTKAEAKRFKAFKINEATHSPWNPQKTDFRRVSELAELWFQHHGQHLVNGAIQKTMLLEFAKSIGDKQARLVTPDDVFRFRNQKLNSGMKATTLNNYLVRIKTMYNKLKKNRRYPL